MASPSLSLGAAAGAPLPAAMRPGPAWPAWLVVAVYLVLYLALDWLSFIHALHGIGITPWNPSPGLSLALLLTQGLRYVPALTVAALLSSALLSTVPVPLPAALAAALVITGGYAAAAVILRRVLRIDAGLRRARDVIALVAVAVVAAALVAAGFIASYAAAGVVPAGAVLEAWFQYWIGDTIGIAVMAPPLLLLARHLARPRPAARGAELPWRAAETALQAASVAAALAAVFGTGRGGEQFKLFYLLFLPLIWIAARHGLAGAAWTVFAIQGGLIAALEFLDQSMETVRSFQLLMFALALTGLFLGAVVSELRRAVRALGASESRLATILATAPDGVIAVDSDGRIEAVNPTVERQFGLGAARLVGRNVRDLLELPGSAGLDPLAESGAAGRELVARRENGDGFPIELTVGRLLLDDERRYTLFIRDVTRRKESEARAAEHQAELAHTSRLFLAGEMASALAHELNQPLTAIVAYARGCARVLRDPAGDRRAVLEAFDEVVHQAERAGAIIARLREFLRQGASHRSTVAVARLIGEALELARVEAAQNGVEIELRLPPDLPEVIVDRIQIEQVLINLVRNAIEAMVGAASPRRAICVEARAVPGEGVEIAVADTGPGIPEDVAARLFEPFITTKPQGMGLGLSISRSIVEAHGGRLEATGQADGATFAFTLPASDGGGGDDAR